MIAMNFPTDLHQQYVTALKTYCIKHQIGFYITGSVASGTAFQYSDIDVVLVSADFSRHINALSNLLQNPIMTNVTENPKGILILIYESGFCVDMDLRLSISMAEIAEMSSIVQVPKTLIEDSPLANRDEHIYDHFKSEFSWYSELRLIHRSLIKYLAHKNKSAFALLDELIECHLALEKPAIYDQKTYVCTIKCVLEFYVKQYDVETGFIRMIERLTAECELI